MRFKRHLCAFAATALVLLLAPRAHAQVQGSFFTIEPWAGYAKYAKNVNFQDSPFFGGTVGIVPFRYIGLEGHVGYGSSKTRRGFTPYSLPPALSTAERDMHALHYGGDLIVNLRPSAYVNPYLLGGWQEARIKYVDSDSVPKPQYLNGIEFGGGVKIRFSPRVALRVEARDAMWKFP